MTIVSIEAGGQAHWLLEQDAATRLVRLARTHAAFATTSDLDASFAAIDAALADVDRTRWRLLIDVRHGPRRNDDAFENAFERHRRALNASFSRVAIVVQSASGKLQVTRHAQSDRTPHVCAFTSEEAALDWLSLPTG